MRKGYKAIRIEVPEEIYESFKEHTQKEYKTQTGAVREMIIQYISERQENSNASQR